MEALAPHQGVNWFKHGPVFSYLFSSWESWRSTHPAAVLRECLVHAYGWRRFDFTNPVVSRLSSLQVICIISRCKSSTVSNLNAKNCFLPKENITRVLAHVDFREIVLIGMSYNQSKMTLQSAQWKSEVALPILINLCSQFCRDNAFPSY